MMARMLSQLPLPLLPSGAAEIAPGRVSQLSRYTQDPSPRMRADVADIIFLAGDAQGVPIVAPLLKDQDKQVAMAAERATMRLKTDR